MLADMSDIDAETLAPSYPMPRTCPLDPAADLGRLRAAQPVSRVRLDFDGSVVWLITRYEDAKTVLADPRFSSDFATPGFPARLTAQPPGPGTFIRMDPPDHTRLRRALIPELVRARVKELEPVIAGHVEQLTDRLLAGPTPTDLVEEFALPLPSQVITDLLGVPYQDREFFHQTTKVMGDVHVDGQTRMKVRNDLRAYLDELIAGKEADLPDDLLGRMSRRRAEAGLSREEVVGIATLLMVAGYETVANQIAVGTVALLAEPGRWAALAADPAKLPAAVEELVRHQTVTDYGARRAATEDVEVAGQLIRKGEGVLVSLAAANRDESVFPDPDRLDLDREFVDHLSFGFGLHQCVGQVLARAQLMAAWSTLLRRIPGLRLAVPVDDVPFRNDMFVYGVHALPVEW
ncbi:cytochrome P450 [Catenulispora acidiphila DSM 44928]|uniref:Cytochrome P450 n=2 Tax=Catenulispora TaxID=414878 RepID=C7PXP7_CATAD|nr:cytochrome P450 [Catenulispora acidiphila DSM 44928]